MLYIFRRRASEGARELSEALTINSRRLNDLGKAHFGNGVRAGDIVICWGEQLNPMNGVRILNGAPVQNKYYDALKLREAGVSTVEVTRDPTLIRNQPPPAPVIWDDFEDLREATDNFTKTRYDHTNPVYKDCVKELHEQFGKLYQHLQIPPPQREVITWLPRRFDHVGGNDLLRPMVRPEYWSKKENLASEYRVHSFNGKSIRAGKKEPREGATPHLWIRSYDGGWSIKYDGFESSRAMRELAHRAVAALGLQFGAVDIGQKPDGGLVVLEVNRAPGLEGGSVDAYAKAVAQWVQEGR